MNAINKREIEELDLGKWSTSEIWLLKINRSVEDKVVEIFNNMEQTAGLENMRKR